MSAIPAVRHVPLCPACGRSLQGGGFCLRCAMTGALDALDEAVADPEKASELSDETRAGLPRRPGGFAVFAPLSLPRRFAHYDLRREIAVGGMGAVYEAQDTRLGRPVALKMIRGAAFSTAEDKARFAAEAGAAAALDHPHIVPIYAVGEAEGQPFFAMKLIAGETLAERLRTRGVLPAREAAALLVEIARAVHHAHQRGVLHRDLKPGNILLDERGEPWLTDFGLAKLLHAESDLTHSEARLGTPHYMSPEQAAGRTRDISTASDVWALGVMLCQMLGGRLPFRGEGGAEIMRRILDEEAPPLDHPDRDLATVVARCLQKDPARRLPSADYLAGELARWLDGAPIRSRPVTPGERAWRWVRRHPYRCAAIALLIVSLLAGSLTSLALWQRAEAARRVAQASAVEARRTRDAAAEAAAVATVGNALAARERWDFAAARRLLAGIDLARRGFEWRLVNGLCRGDEDWSVSSGGAEPRGLAFADASRRRVAVLTDDRRLHFLDPRTGRAEAGPLVPAVPAGLIKDRITQGLRCLAFAPDGRHFACADGDALLAVETATGRLIFSREEEAAEALWLDSGRLLHACGSQHNTEKGGAFVRVFEPASGRDAPLSPEGFTGPLALSADGSRLAWTRAGTAVEVRRVADLAAPPEAVFSAAGVEQPVAGVAFSPDGKCLAVGWGFVDRALVRVYPLGGGAAVPSFEHWLPCGAQLAVALSAAPPQLFLAAREPWIGSWRHLDPPGASDTYDDGRREMSDSHRSGGPFEPPRQLLTRSAQAGRAGFLFGHEAAVRQLLFLPEENALLSAGGDGTVRRWPLASRVPARQRRDDALTLHEWLHPTASPDGRLVFYSRRSDGCAVLWDRAANAETVFPDGHDPLAALDDGRALTRVGATGEIVCWQMLPSAFCLLPSAFILSPLPLWRVQGIPSHAPGYGHVIASAFSGDGRRLAALLPGRWLVVDLDTHLARGTGDQRMIYGVVPGQSIDLSPDGRLVAVTGFLGHRARLYSADDPAAAPRLLAAAAEYSGSDSACAFSRDGRRLFVGNDDGRVRVFDPTTGRELPAEGWRAHTGAVTVLAVSRRGDIVATAADGALCLWDAAAPRPGSPPRRERLQLSPGAARDWVQFGGAGNEVLLHAAPGAPIEAWEAPPAAP